MCLRLTRLAAACLLGLTATASPGRTEPVPPDLYAGLRWRMIGPFRGGRTVGATGVPGQPNVFYIGVNNGGVWKTTDAGRTWKPIFDDQPTGSIGALAVAPSNPDVLYVGSGEGLQRPDLSTGDGVYKSTDGGKTWKNLGLRDGQQISRHPRRSARPRPRLRRRARPSLRPQRRARRLPHRPTAARPGRRCSTRTRTPAPSPWPSIPPTPQTVYAVLWAARQGPWENGAWQGPGSGLFKSTDGGTTWKPLTKGLPDRRAGPGPHRHRASPRAIRSASTPWSTPRSSAASIAPTMPARAGSASTASSASGAAAATSPR